MPPQPLTGNVFNSSPNVTMVKTPNHFAPLKLTCRQALPRHHPTSSKSVPNGICASDATGERRDVECNKPTHWQPFPITWFVMLPSLTDFAGHVLQNNPLQQPHSLKFFKK